MAANTISNPTAAEKKEGEEAPNPYGWWFADCPRHGRTPHLSILGGDCERCAAEKLARPWTERTRQ
jgi:hypothetical protein